MNKQAGLALQARLRNGSRGEPDLVECMAVGVFAFYWDPVSQSRISLIETAACSDRRDLYSLPRPMYNSARAARVRARTQDTSR